MVDLLHLNRLNSVPLKSEDVGTLSPFEFHILKQETGNENLYSQWTGLFLEVSGANQLLEPFSPGEERFFYLANTERQFYIIQKISVVSLPILRGKDGEW